MFRRRARTETTVATLDPERRLSSLWTDPLGRVAIRSAQVLLVLAVVVAIVFATIQLKLVVIPMLIALILAAALHPLVNALSRRMPRGLAAVITLLLGVVLFGGIVTIAVFGIQSQFDSLVESVSEGIDRVVDFVNNGPIPIDEDQIAAARQAVIDFVTSREFGTGAIAGVTTVIELIAGVVLGVFILFYFTKDGPQMWAFLVKPLGAVTQTKARRAGDRAVGVLGGYVRGTTLVAFVDALFIGLAMWILQVPLALPLAIVVFVGAFIPVVGATITGIIAALVTLVTVDLTAAIWLTIVVIVVNQLEGNFLSPVVLGKSLKLHELIVLLALTAGTILGGIVGTLLSVPIAAVAWAVIKSWNEPAAPLSPADPRPGTRAGWGPPERV